MFSTESQRGTVSSECLQIFLITAVLVLTASVCLTGGRGFHPDSGAFMSSPEQRLHTLPHRRSFRVHAPRVSRPQVSSVGSDGSGLRSGSGAHCAARGSAAAQIRQHRGRLLISDHYRLSLGAYFRFWV